MSVKDLYVRKTLESFDYQWLGLPKGKGLVTDAFFRDSVETYFTKPKKSPYWFERYRTS